MQTSSREPRLTPGPEGIVRQVPVDAEASSLARGIESATAELLKQQRPDGHWIFELEADATIPAEYVLLQHYLGTIDSDFEQRIAFAS